jgi:hypothetical protein
LKATRAIAASIVIAGALAACERQSTKVTESATPPSSASTPTPAPATTTQPNAQSTTVDYTQSMERLHKAASGLRESIQALAQRQVGAQRTVTIAMARQALTATNQAMAQLPPDMRVDTAGATSSAAASGSTASLGSQPDTPQSVEALQKAAEQLRKSIQLMADEPAGDRRNEAIKAAHQALNDTNQAMIQLPSKTTANK